MNTRDKFTLSVLNLFALRVAIGFIITMIFIAGLIYLPALIGLDAIDFRLE
jgi:hypothetical protein